MSVAIGGEDFTSPPLFIQLINKQVQSFKESHPHASDEEQIEWYEGLLNASGANTAFNCAATRLIGIYKSGQWEWRANEKSCPAFNTIVSDVIRDLELDTEFTYDVEILFLKENGEFVVKETRVSITNQS